MSEKTDINTELLAAVEAGLRYCEALCGVGYAAYQADPERLWQQRTVSHEQLDALFNDWMLKQGAALVKARGN